MLLVQVAGGLVLVVLVLAFLLRGRVGSSRPSRSSRSETRPTLPPSPYQPSRGFKILDGSEPDEPHAVQLPRLDPNKEFVFGDHVAPSSEPLSVPHLRHDEQWALDRSMRHAPHPRIRRRRRLTWTVIVLVLAAGIVVALVLGVHLPTHPKVKNGVAPYGVAPSSWIR